MPKNLEAGALVAVRLTEAAGGGALTGNLVEPLMVYSGAYGVTPVGTFTLVGPYAHPVTVEPDEIALMRYLVEPKGLTALTRGPR